MKESMTWQNLKDFCNSIEEKFLHSEVVFQREDEFFNVKAHSLEENHFIPVDGEPDDVLAESTLNLHRAVLDKEYPEGFELWKEKGYPILYKPI